MTFLASARACLAEVRSLARLGVRRADAARRHQEALAAYQRAREALRGEALRLDAAGAWDAGLPLWEALEVELVEVATCAGCGWLALDEDLGRGWARAYWCAACRPREDATSGGVVMSRGWCACGSSLQPAQFTPGHGKSLAGCGWCGKRFLGHPECAEATARVRDEHERTCNKPRRVGATRERGL